MKLRRIPSVLRKISDGKITRAAAAERLECGERHVNRLMRMHGVRRPVGRSHKAKVTAQARRDQRERAARAVLAGVHDELYASRMAGCSPRTIFRWVAKLKKLNKNNKKPRKKR